MGAIMYSFARACNPLISKNILSRGIDSWWATLPPGLILVTDNLQLILRVSLDLLLGKRQGPEFFLGKCLGLVLEVFRRRVAGQRECQHALGTRALLIERHDLQVAATTDDLTLAIRPGH